MRHSHAAEAQWWVLVATVAVVPLAFSTWTADVFNLTSLTVVWVGAILAIGLEILAGRRRLPASRIWLVVAAYLAVLALTTVTSRSPEVSFLGLYGRYGGLVTVVPVVILALLLARAMAGAPARRSQAMVALVASAVAGAAYLWAQQLGIDWFGWLDPTGRQPRHPPGALGNANFSGAHLALAVGPALVLTVENAGRRRLAAASAAAVILSGVGVSQSRGAMLACAAAIIAVALGSGLSRRLLGAGVTAAALLVGLTALATGSSGDLVGTRTLDERAELWQVAFEGAADRPILGGGPDLYVLTFREHAGPALAGVIADEPHNVLLDHLDGSGVLGAGAWLAVVAAVVAVARRNPAPRTQLPWVALGAAYLSQAMVSIDVVPLQLWGWVAAAGVVGASPVEPAPGPRSGRAPRALVAAAAVGTVALIAVALGPFRADMAHRRGIEAANVGDQDRALAQLTQATERNGWEPRFHRRLGIQLAVAAREAPGDGLAEAAAAELDRALELLPGDAVARRWRASITDP